MINSQQIFKDAQRAGIAKANSLDIERRQSEKILSKILADKRASSEDDLSFKSVVSSIKTNADDEQLAETIYQRSQGPSGRIIPTANGVPSQRPEARGKLSDDELADAIFEASKGR